MTAWKAGCNTLDAAMMVSEQTDARLADAIGPRKECARVVNAVHHRAQKVKCQLQALRCGSTRTRRPCAKEYDLGGAATASPSGGTSHRPASKLVSLPALSTLIPPASAERMEAG